MSLHVKVSLPSLLRAVFLAILTAALVFEGYYISVLKDRICRQTEDLKSISMQLQSLRNERDSLHEELASIKKSAGENKDEHTSDRQH